MPKSRRMRKMVAGSIWDSIKNGWNSASQTASSGWNSLTQDVTGTTEKKSTTDYLSSNSNSNSNASLYPSSNTSSSNNYSSYSSSLGGKRPKKKRGGSGMSSNLAANAGPVSDSPTAQASWVGGSRRRTRKTKKTRKSRKH